jgi:hypothetical protein
MSKIFLRHTLTKTIIDIFNSLSLYIFTIWQCIAYNFFCRDGIYLEPLNRNESGRFGALKSDSTHHFFRNACTKSVSLRFSQFSGCWLILSVYIIMSFDFPFEFHIGTKNLKIVENHPINIHVRFALIIFVVSAKKALEHFPIGSNVNLWHAKVTIPTLNIALKCQIYAIHQQKKL